MEVCGSRVDKSRVISMFESRSDVCGAEKCSSFEKLFFPANISTHKPKDTMPTQLEEVQPGLLPVSHRVTDSLSAPACWLPPPWQHPDPADRYAVRHIEGRMHN